MTIEKRPLSFWSTVRLLLSATRARSAGRRKRQQELLQQRSKNATDWSGLGFAMAVLFMAFLNGGAAFILQMAVETGQRIQVERQGKIVVSQSFLDGIISAQRVAEATSSVIEDSIPATFYSSEAREIAEDRGGDKAAIEQKLRDAVRNHGTRDFVTKREASPGLVALQTTGVLPAMLGSFVLIWWAMMLIFQGEGLELDLQRRRHPMWEWLFSHPVQPGAVFLAEMLSPIAANPIYWSGPLFAGFLYGFIYGPGLGFIAAFVIGIPLTIAAACLGKALEIGIILRFPPRSRGAMIGLMGWMGYASMMLFFVGAFVIPKIVTIIAGFLGFFATLPWPWLSLFVGGQQDGSFSFLAGTLTCWLIAAVTIAGAIWFSVWGTQRGLTGNFAQPDSGPSVSATRGARFGKEPLYRKEFLWFIRDRSAIVQVILIPLTVAGFQVFNLRGLLSHAQGTWNYLCGTGILFGTYFLWILGPKSLSSEGRALWIAMTWPRGLESLLKAKAWLWSLISSGMVAWVLCYAAYLFPASIWKIALVGIGWFVFGRSMAEKTVTLVSVTSSSGEREQIPWTRRGAAQLGMLTFCIGVLTQQWHIAIMGIVYSYLTAAAMWQNFRARLPYLYDPWSEKVPSPPTLMHAMIAISILVEGGAVLTGFVLVLAGRENIAIAQAISYGICAVIVSVGTQMFLSDRGVLPHDVWRWGADAQQAPAWWRFESIRNGKSLSLLLLGTAGGVALGLFAHGYLAVLQHIPAAAEIIRKAQEQMAKIPDLKVSYAVMAIGFAPFAEEYLFRGLLFKALDREWGGWHAVVGSAAFFAIYHPALSWPPVALLGVVNALVFKKTGRLAPAVVLHMVYNAVVLA
jgi:membrane protease YdiL (CAAX protease family)